MVVWVIVSIGLLWASFRIKDVIDEQDFVPEYGKPANFNLLGTINGIGASFYGSFRVDDVSEVKYIFICFIGMPVIPISCRRVKEWGSSGVMPIYKTTYKIYSKERWSVLEILQVYLRYWGGASSIASVLFYLYDLASNTYLY